MASLKIYELGAEEVTLRHKSLREAALSYNLIHTFLYRYIKNKAAFEANETTISPSVGCSEKTVFSFKVLCDYLIKSALEGLASI